MKQSLINNSLCNAKYLDSEGLLYVYLQLLNKFNSIINNYNYEDIIKKYGIKAGPTISRPTTNLKIGLPYFDTDLNRPIWWNGNQWIDSCGDNADLFHRGGSDKQPNARNVSVGFTYYNTDDKVLYVSNGETWEIVNCCGTIDDVIIWANIVSGGIVSYDYYDFIGWSNTEDDSYIQVDNIEYWTNL